MRRHLVEEETQNASKNKKRCSFALILGDTNSSYDEITFCIV